MIILGIDPGSLKAGYAFIEISGRKYKHLSSGVMNFTKEKEFLDRPGIIFNSCIEIIKEFSPDEIAFESLIFAKGTTSMMKLAQSRGAMLAAFLQTHKGRVFEYSPNLVKQSVTGYGHATKESIQKALNMIFGRVDYKTFDESDALAIALCHALNSRGRSEKNFTHRR